MFDTMDEIILHEGDSIKMFLVTQKLPRLGSRCLCFYISDQDKKGKKQVGITAAEHDFIDFCSPPVFCDYLHSEILSHVFLWGYLPNNGFGIDKELLG